MRHVFFRLILSAAIILTLASLGIDRFRPLPARAQGGNLLQNPGFEDPYVSINGDTTLTVANSWQP